MVEIWFVLALGYAFFHALVSVLDSQAYKSTQISSLAYSGVRYLMNAFFSTILIIFLGFSIFQEVFYPVILISIFYFGAGLTYFKAIKRGEVSQLIPYRDSITTLLSFFLAIIFLSESASLFNMLGVFIIAIGGYIVWTDGKLALPRKSLEIILIAISAFFLSGSGIISKVALQGVSATTLSFLMYALVSIYFLALNLFFNKKDFFETSKTIIENKKVLALVIAASISAVLGIYFFYTALQLADAAKVLPMAGTLPLFAALIGWLGLKEKHGPARFVGAVLIAIGAALVYL